METKEKTKLIYDAPLLETVLERMLFNFTDEAAKSVIGYLSRLWRVDPRLAKELAESRRLLQLVFDLDERYDEPELTEMHTELLAYLMDRKCANVWDFIKPSFPHELKMVSETLSHFVLNFKQIPEKQVPTFCLELANMLEDAAMQNPHSSELVQAFGRLVLALDKADLLYVSLPVLPVFDRRLLMAVQARDKVDPHCAREGGMIRIALKLAVQCISSENAAVAADACGIFKFIMFRDREQRKSLKRTFLPGMHPATMKKGGKKRVEYNLVDLALRSDKAKMKLHASRTEMFAKRAIKGRSAFVDSTAKGGKATAKEENAFEQGPLVLLYVLVQMFQTVHFDLLGVRSYAELPQSLEELHLKFESVNSDLAPSPRLTAIIDMLQELAVRYGGKDSALAKLLTSGFESLMHTLRPKMCAYCTPSMPSSPIEGSSAHPNSETAGSHESSQLELIEDFKSNPKPEQTDLTFFAAQEQEFDQFVKLWSMLADAMLTSLADRRRTVTASKVMESLLLKPICIQVVQPFGRVCLADEIQRLDYMLSKALSKVQSLPLSAPREQDHAIYNELAVRIRDKFCYLSIHSEKIGTLRFEYHMLR